MAKNANEITVVTNEMLFAELRANRQATERLEAIVTGLESRVTALESGKGQTPKAPKQSKAPKAPKQAQAQAQDQDQEPKVPAPEAGEEWTPKQRAAYEAKAKELGCFAFGKVVATVVDGEVKATRRQNRKAIYEALGWK